MRSNTAAGAIVPVVNFCAKCRDELKAFIRKPENGDPLDAAAGSRAVRAVGRARPGATVNARRRARWLPAGFDPDFRFAVPIG